MNRFIWAVISVLVSVFFASPAWAGYGDPDGDYVGNGSAPPPSFYVNHKTTWPLESDGDDCGSSFNPPLGCQYVYNNYRLNCLPDTTTGPAYQIIIAYPDTQDGTNTFLDRNLAPMRRMVKGAASIFAGSFLYTLDATDYLQKGADRTPRFITLPENSDGVCQPKFLEVPVPKRVLLRDPLQGTYNGDTSKNGVMAYLETIGYNQPNRRYFVFSDYSVGFTNWEMSSTAGPNTVYGQAVNMQKKGILWGPYGSGQLSDVDTRPTLDNLCNSGGVVGNINLGIPDVTTDYWAQKNNSSGDGFAVLFAHEMGHTTCQNYLAPHWQGDSHMSEDPDLMGTGTDPQSCAGMTYDNKVMRFDCAHDDYWGNADYNSQFPWATQRWSSSDNQFLWGAPKRNPVDDTWFSLDAVGIDCVNLAYNPDWCAHAEQ